MKIEEIEIGKCYSRHDDAVYKVIEKGENWVCILHYSYNHQCCSVEIHGNDFLSDLDLEKNCYIYDIFDNLIIDEHWENTLVCKKNIVEEIK